MLTFAEVLHSVVPLHRAVLFRDEVSTAGVLMGVARGERWLLSYHPFTVDPLLSPTGILD